MWNLYESFIVVDAGNNALRLITDCKHSSAEVSLLVVETSPKDEEFDFTPDFIDSVDNQLGMGSFKNTR